MNILDEPVSVGMTVTKPISGVSVTASPSAQEIEALIEKAKEKGLDLSKPICSVEGSNIQSDTRRGMRVENDEREIIGITCASVTDEFENAISEKMDSTRSFRLTKPITVDLNCVNFPFSRKAKKQKRRLKTRKFEW